MVNLRTTQIRHDKMAVRRQKHDKMADKSKKFKNLTKSSKIGKNGPFFGRFLGKFKPYKCTYTQPTTRNHLTVKQLGKPRPLFEKFRADRGMQVRNIFFHI